MYDVVRELGRPEVSEVVLMAMQAHDLAKEIAIGKLLVEVCDVLAEFQLLIEPGFDQRSHRSQERLFR